MRVVVTGLGVVSAAGVGVEQNLDTLRAGRSGIISYPHHFATRHAVPVGEVALSNQQLKELLGLSGTISRTALLGMVAATEALRDAGGEVVRTAFISATSVGGMDLTEQFYDDYRHDSSRGLLRMVAHHDCADSTLAIARHCGIEGFSTTVSTACSSAANALMLGARLLRHGLADRVVAGGADALCRFTLNGFKSLMILDPELCRPLDATRAGLNLGEGAAYVVLEREQDCICRPYGYLAGYANANDAHHQTASSPHGEGAYLAMRGAMELAGVEPSWVSYVNLHGTGTPNNDLTESVAMRRIFGDILPPFSSTKGCTGHTLAAAGAIEAIFSILALEHQEIYPSLNFSTIDPQIGVAPCTEHRPAKVECVLSNSFGFGGNCSSLIFTR